MSHSFSYETKTALAAAPVKERCCKKALLFGLLYPFSDFRSDEAADDSSFRSLSKGSGIHFSTDNEKCAVLLSGMVKSLCRTEAIWEQLDQRTRKGEVKTLWRLLGGEELLNDALLADLTEAVGRIDRIMVCENCIRAFLRGLFLSVGSIVDPAKAYHLEFAVSKEHKCQQIAEFLCGAGFPVRITVRRGVRAIYLKESEAVEDFFTFVGAPQTALAIMNAKILRDIRNNENRKANCDTANIYKSTGAAAAQLRAIRKLKQDGRLQTLPEPLRITAELRLNYPEVSLAELAALHEPPITKSGVTHRLQKLLNACKDEPGDQTQ